MLHAINGGRNDAAPVRGSKNFANTQRLPREFKVLIEQSEIALTHFLRRMCSEHDLDDHELELILFGISMRHPSWTPLSQEDLRGDLVQSDPELVLDFMGTEQHVAFCVRAIITLGITGDRLLIVTRILSHIFQAHRNQNALQS